MHLEPLTSAGPRYEIPEDEQIEDDLVVDGETVADPQDDETIPIRVLDDFAIYEWFGLHMVGIAELLSLTPESEDGITYGASGIVRSYTDSSDDEDDGDDGSETSAVVPSLQPRVKLSQIIEFNVHNVSCKRGRDLQIDP